MTSFYECVEIELKSFIKQYCFIEPNDELLSLIGTQWDQLVSRIQNDERNRVLRDLWDDLLTDVFKSSLFEQFVRFAFYFGAKKLFSSLWRQKFLFTAWTCES